MTRSQNRAREVRHNSGQTADLQSYQMRRDYEPDLVSVIIPTFNRARLLVDAMDSVFAQTHRPIELIVVDDGSTDGTKKVIEDWREKCRKDSAFTLRYLCQENRGAPAARNAGLSECRGEFIQYLDSDDYLHRRKLAIQIADIRRTGKDAALCDFGFVADSSGRPFLVQRNSSGIFRIYSKASSLSIFAPLVKREAIPPCLWWNEKLRCSQDIDYFFRFAMTGCSFVYRPGVLAYYRRDESARITGSMPKVGCVLGVLNSILEFIRRERCTLSEGARRAVCSMSLCVAVLLLAAGQYEQVRRVGRDVLMSVSSPMLELWLRGCVALSCVPIARDVVGWMVGRAYSIRGRQKKWSPEAVRRELA